MTPELHGLFSSWLFASDFLCKVAGNLGKDMSAFEKLLLQNSSALWIIMICSTSY